MEYIFVKIGFNKKDVDEKELYESLINSIALPYGVELNVSNSMNKEQADYVSYTINDNPI